MCVLKYNVCILKYIHTHIRNKLILKCIVFILKHLRNKWVLKYDVL